MINLKKLFNDKNILTEIYGVATGLYKLDIEIADIYFKICQPDEDNPLHIIVWSVDTDDIKLRITEDGDICSYYGEFDFSDEAPPDFTMLRNLLELSALLAPFVVHTDDEMFGNFHDNPELMES